MDWTFWAIFGFAVMIGAPWLDNFFMNRYNFVVPAMVGFTVFGVSVFNIIAK